MNKCRLVRRPYVQRRLAVNHRPGPLAEPRYSIHAVEGNTALTFEQGRGPGSSAPVHRAGLASRETQASCSSYAAVGAPRTPRYGTTFRGDWSSRSACSCWLGHQSHRPAGHSRRCSYAGSTSTLCCPVPAGSEVRLFGASSVAAISAAAKALRIMRTSTAPRPPPRSERTHTQGTRPFRRLACRASR